MKAENAWANVRVLEATAIVRPRKAQPERGRGFVTNPTAVNMKIDVRFQAWSTIAIRDRHMWRIVVQ